jgi:hypothetical protein
MGEHCAMRSRFRGAKSSAKGTVPTSGDVPSRALHHDGADNGGPGTIDSQAGEAPDRENEVGSAKYGESGEEPCAGQVRGERGVQESIFSPGGAAHASASSIFLRNTNWPR